MKKKIRILHVLSSHIYSGAENVVCQLISMFRSDPDYEMVYCSPDGPIREALEARQVSYVPIEKVCRREIQRVIAEVSPNLVHAHDVRASIVCAMAAGGVGGNRLPVISHIHACFDSMTKISAKSLSYLLFSGSFKKIFWVSESSLKHYAFSGMVRGKSQILYNVIDPDKLKQRLEEDTASYGYDVVFLGRFTDQKNPKRIVGILECLQKQLQLQQEPLWQGQFQAAMIGDGALYSSIQQMVQEKGLEQVIALPGYQSNPYKALASAKAFLMASRYEGTPMSVLEAMALGVPVVSTATDGIADVVKSGVTGYLEETDEKLAERLKELLTDPKKQKSMSEASKKQFAQTCDRKKYRQTLDTVYQENAVW